MEDSEGGLGPGLELKGKGSWLALSEALLWEGCCYIMVEVLITQKTDPREN